MKIRSSAVSVARCRRLPTLASTAKTIKSAFYHEVSWKKKHGEDDIVKALDFKHPAVAEPDLPAVPLKEPFARIEMIAAPFNPADAMDIAGRYPTPYVDDDDDDDASSDDGVVVKYADLRRSVHCPRRTVAGSEGWGRVTEVMGEGGPCDHINVSAGDYVVPGAPLLGT